MGLALLSADQQSDGASGFSFVSCRKGNADSAQTPNGVFPVDLHGMRRRLPDEWAGFLRQHFNSDVRMIRALFGCDEKTARDWLSGKHGVNGAPLLMLIRENPAARQFFLGEVA